MLYVLPGYMKWYYTTYEGLIYSPPLVGPDGTIYVGSDNQYLYALSPTGNDVFQYQMVLSNCTIISGVLISQYHTAGYIYTSPVVGPDGTIYAVSCLSEYCTVYSVTSTGNLSKMLSHDIIEIALRASDVVL